MCAALPLHMSGQPLLLIGPQIGRCFANASIAPLHDGLDATTKGGFILGLEADIPVHASCSVVVSPRFIEKGSVLKYADADMEELLYNYIELPIHARLAFGRQPLSPFLQAGATVGLLVSAQHRTFFQHGYAWQYVDELTEPYNVSLDAGAGFMLNLGGRFRFVATFAYSHGLTNVVRGAAGIATTAWHSRDMCASLACLYAIGR